MKTLLLIFSLGMLGNALAKDDSVVLSGPSNVDYSKCSQDLQQNLSSILPEGLITVLDDGKISLKNDKNLTASIDPDNNIKIKYNLYHRKSPIGKYDMLIKRDAKRNIQAVTVSSPIMASPQQNPLIFHRENYLFEIKGNQCIRKERTTFRTINPVAAGLLAGRASIPIIPRPKISPQRDPKSLQSIAMKTHITALCKDIYDFVNHPQRANCFRKDMHNKMLQIFDKHAPQDKKWEEKFYLPSNDTKKRIDKARKWDGKTLYNNPLSMGTTILEDCIKSGAGLYFDDLGLKGEAEAGQSRSGKGVLDDK